MVPLPFRRIFPTCPPLRGRTRGGPLPPSGGINGGWDRRGKMCGWRLVLTPALSRRERKNRVRNSGRRVRRMGAPVMATVYSDYL
jgi:hypothetical protein